MRYPVIQARSAVGLTALLLALPALQGPAPAPRACHSAAATRSGLVIWGGARACGVDVLADSAMWTWNGSTWSALPGPPIAPREDALLVADPATNSLWLYGGRARGQVFSDLWLFDGKSWHLLAAQGGPGAVEHAAAAYDRDRRRLVVYGGGIGRTTSGVTWEYNGTAWTRIDARGPAPRVGHGMAWSQVDGGVVLYGGFSADQYRDLWEWDGSRWHLLASDGPTTTEGHVVAEAEGGIQVVGPGLGQDTVIRVWQWDGKAFRERGSSGPGIRVGATATFDRRRGRLVYWGGATSAGQPSGGAPAEFDGTKWNRP